MATPAFAVPPIFINQSSSDNLDGGVDADGFARLESPMNGIDDQQLTLEDETKDNVTTSESSPTSDEDYDAIVVDLQGRQGNGLQSGETLEITASTPDVAHPASSNPSKRRKSIPLKLQKTSTGRYLLKADDPEIREIIQRSLETGGHDKKRRNRFSDLVFTRQFTAFDRQNRTGSGSPFHGFFTLFWLGVGFMLLKVAANNWKVYGSVFGRHEILSLMWNGDVVELGLSDCAMMACTAVSLALQKVIAGGWLSWNKSGWIIQNIWQALFLAGTLSYSSHRRWPWTHNVFITLHCIVMLMKQHSYAFYNGHLSEVYRRKKTLERKLQELDEFDPQITGDPTSPNTATFASSYFDVQKINNLNRRRLSRSASNEDKVRRERSDIASVAAAVKSGEPLDMEQLASFERVLRLEIEGLAAELKGKCTSTPNVYPHNVNIRDFASYIPLPTVVYELEYPRQGHIKWWYVTEKAAATFGVIGVMIAISEAHIYPVVMDTVRMKEAGMSIRERLKEFPWVLSDLLFPFMMEYLLAWYVIWECILNLLAELTLFADRGFYADWWNSISWDQFARDWNVPVHNFLLRHVYHSSISAFKISRPLATLITFLLSATVHELVMWSIFKKLRGYLLGMQMLQLPLVMLSRTRMLRERKVLGNVMFWVGIFTGPSLLCSLYLII